MNLAQINGWSDDEAMTAFRRCCGSARWCERMNRLRPFGSEPAVFEAADRAWWALEPADWLEAFAAHPRIGDFDAIKTRFAATAAWSAREQAGVAAAPEEVLRELAEANDRYERRFGYRFLVCATGKTAEAMLDLLRRRLPNEPDVEIRTAAAEQAKIARLRLERIAP